MCGLWDRRPKCYKMAAMTPEKPAFPAPDHDHDRCAAEAITHAEQVCALRAQKLTPIRRQVLQALLTSHRPLGAYELIDALAKSMRRPAPLRSHDVNFLRGVAATPNHPEPKQPSAKESKAGRFRDGIRTNSK